MAKEDSIIASFQQLLENDVKSDSFYETIGYSFDQYKSLNLLEENLLDRITFIFRKEMRRELVADGLKGMVDGGHIFLKAMLSEEGRAYIRVLEEHIPSKFVLYFILVRLFEKFEDRLNQVPEKI